MKLDQILVAIDFAEPSEHALDVAIDLAKQFGAALSVVHVVEVPSYVYTETTYATTELIGSVEQAARLRFDALIERAQERMPGAQALLRRGTPWEEIIGAARDKGAELIVIGTHGRRGISHLLIGSVAEKVIRASPVPVLTVRSGAKS
jgi:nucleotide-binding universal stress UspA family protein